MYHGFTRRPTVCETFDLGSHIDQSRYKRSSSPKGVFSFSTFQVSLGGEVVVVNRARNVTTDLDPGTRYLNLGRDVEDEHRNETAAVRG